MGLSGQEALNLLLEGNHRFITASNPHRTYDLQSLKKIAVTQEPIAAIIACADSRVVPEVLFDQELGSLFVSRVPANVASDGTKWMIDIAVGEFKVPLVLVLGHTGCLAIKQIIEGKSGSGGALRYKVQSAFHEARLKHDAPVYETTIEQNSLNTCRDLSQESHVLSDAVRAGTTLLRAAVYDMPTGVVRLLPQDQGLQSTPGSLTLCPK